MELADLLEAPVEKLSPQDLVRRNLAVQESDTTRAAQIARGELDYEVDVFFPLFMSQTRHVDLQFEREWDSLAYSSRCIEAGGAGSSLGGLG